MVVASVAKHICEPFGNHLQIGNQTQIKSVDQFKLCDARNLERERTWPTCTSPKTKKQRNKEKKKEKGHV